MDHIFTFLLRCAARPLVCSTKVLEEALSTSRTTDFFTFCGSQFVNIMLPIGWSLNCHTSRYVILNHHIHHLGNIHKLLGLVSWSFHVSVILSKKIIHNDERQEKLKKNEEEDQTRDIYIAANFATSDFGCGPLQFI